MKKTAYILSYHGNGCAVILATNETDLKDKLKEAIQEEASAEKNAQFSLSLERIGDWGETTNIRTCYVNDGELVEDNEFTLTKTVLY